MSNIVEDNTDDWSAIKWLIFIVVLSGITVLALEIII